MDAYSIVLFVHIVGVLGLFVALGLEWTGLRQIRSAIVPEQVRAWMFILKTYVSGLVVFIRQIPKRSICALLILTPIQRISP